MKLIEQSVRGFVNKTSGNDPVPGGGSISALCGSISAALTHMVAHLTIGKKKYADVEAQMKELADKALQIQEDLLLDIDKDSDSYDIVFKAFKMPKDTDEEKATRSAEIQRTTKIAAEVPMSVAEKTYRLIPLIEEVVMKGNQNAITDGCVAMMCCRTAVLGALLNVRINLSSLKDEVFVTEYKAKAERMEREIDAIERRILDHVYTQI
ncbi:MAG: cyclodeaminase/cyclohydrolase family protein [Porphyromonas sp.]|nr:cyclodeaminase/cyclohydrolase family protein [Porphyromonas sp.]